MTNYINAAIVGMGFGFICGVGPLVYGMKRKKEGMALASLVLCGVAGAIYGLFLAVPVAGIMFAVMSDADKSNE